LRGRGYRAIERHLERDVAILGAVEAQVVAEKEKALLARRDLVDDLRQVDKIVLFHLNEAQALLAVFVEQALDDRRLAGAARAGEEDVVRRQPGEELPRVLLHALDLALDAAQVGEANAMQLAHRLQVNSVSS